MKINVFWFRRDLRLDDNAVLSEALKSGLPVLPVFIFDTNITDELPADDARISFIYDSLWSINNELQKTGKSVLVKKGRPLSIWTYLISTYEINSVYAARDYEPYAIARDEEVGRMLGENGVGFFLIRDQVIFEADEILKSDRTPYTVFTPYKKAWIRRFHESHPDNIKEKKLTNPDFYMVRETWFPSMEELGFRKSLISVRNYDLSIIPQYHLLRDIPFADKTTYLSPHLRFGTISIRTVITVALRENPTFLSELIWREFFMQILYHFPGVITENFRPAYNNIKWRNNESEFERWRNGETGYPIVDAGMRQLNTTGYMHNRVRMIAAGFLCKHLLIDWRWGEAFFAEKLLDYELSSNNGNWQWAAGTGCDAVPYFRIFNPVLQQKRFDAHNEYIKKWVQEFGKPSYPAMIVDHETARKRAISAYRAGISPF